MHYQEYGECSICGSKGSGSDWVKLTADHLNGVAYAVIPGQNNQIYYYLCPQCKKILKNWVGYKTKIEQKREKVGSSWITTTRTYNDPIEIPAVTLTTDNCVYVNNI